MTIGERPQGVLGGRQRRIDGPQLLTGRARFVDDAPLGRTLHLGIVRSTQPHALIESIRLDEVRSRAGVEVAVSGAELASTVGPIPPFIDPRARGAKATDVRCLAVERVTYVGQPIAAILATSRQVALDAALAVEVDYAPLAAVPDAAAAVAPDAPLLYPDWGDNVLLSRRYGADTATAAVDAAPIVVEGELALQRCSTAPIELRACLASWDAASERLTVQATCQNPHHLRWMIAAACNLQENDVRVVVPRLGGSFGLKMAGHPEEVLTAALAVATQSAVRWSETRADSLKHGAREQRHRYRIGFDSDGRILGFHDEILADAGAATAQAGWGMPNLTALTLTTGYDIQEAGVELRLAVTNKPPLAAARGFGKDSAHIVMERAVDEVAARLHIDPAVVRARNFIRADDFPYRTAAGLNVDSGDYGALLSLALETANYTERRALQPRLRQAGPPSRDRHCLRGHPRIGGRSRHAGLRLRHGDRSNRPRRRRDGPGRGDVAGRRQRDRNRPGGRERARCERRRRAGRPGRHGSDALRVRELQRAWDVDRGRRGRPRGS